MDNQLAKRMDDVDSLHVEIDNLNGPIVKMTWTIDWLREWMMWIACMLR